jgi:hypothetical protein
MKFFDVEGEIFAGVDEEQSFLAWIAIKSSLILNRSWMKWMNLVSNIRKNRNKKESSNS